MYCASRQISNTKILTEHGECDVNSLCVPARIIGFPPRPARARAAMVTAISRHRDGPAGTADLLGPNAWVQGRRTTSKVTATSGGRLTNRYAWVPGRPTRRASLGVNLSLRVPPCKHYPEEVTQLKMATLILLRYRQRRLLRRNRIFRDRTNPLGKFNDLELFWKLDSDKRIFSK